MSFNLGEEKLNRAIDDIRAVESEKLQIAIAEEKRRAEELEATIGQLRQVRIMKKYIYLFAAKCLPSQLAAPGTLPCLIIIFCYFCYTNICWILLIKYTSY